MTVRQYLQSHGSLFLGRLILSPTEEEVLEALSSVDLQSPDTPVLQQAFQPEDEEPYDFGAALIGWVFGDLILHYPAPSVISHPRHGSIVIPAGWWVAALDPGDWLDSEHPD